MKFEKYLIEDVLNIKYGKNQKKVKDENGSYPILGTGGLMGYANDFLYDKPSVLIGRKGSIRKVRFIEEPFWTVDTLFYTEVNEKIVYPKYIYYYLSLIDFNYYNEGTTIPSLRTQTLNQIEISIPSKNEQRKILNIINPIENKIELNNSIISNLEELAQTLFKHWFIDFEFPNENGEPYKSSGGKMVESELGMIPEGWEAGKLGDLFKVRSGYAFKSNWWIETGDKVIKIKDLKDNSVSLSDLSCVSQDKSSLASDFEVQAGDLLIALTGATLGKIGLVPKTNGKLFVNQRVGKIFIEGNPIKEMAYIFGLLLQNEIIHEIIEQASGSAQSNLSPTNIEKVKGVIPPKLIIKKFNDTFTYVIRKITELQFENENLTELRDTLLPKLLSGEIELPESMEVTDDVPIS